jgi:hypothetical protein
LDPSRPTPLRWRALLTLSVPSSLQLCSQHWRSRTIYQSYTHRGGMFLPGDIFVRGGLSVPGATSVWGGLSVFGATSVRGGWSVLGATSLCRCLSILGATFVCRGLSVRGGRSVLGGIGIIITKGHDSDFALFGAFLVLVALGSSRKKARALLLVTCWRQARKKARKARKAFRAIPCPRSHPPSEVKQVAKTVYVMSKLLGSSLNRRRGDRRRE